MRRLATSAAGLVVVLVLMLAPLLGSADSEAGSAQETARISDYDARFAVDEAGTLRATETLRVDFPEAKHGIFRFFDLDDPADDHVRFVPRDISVTRDGRAEELSLSSQGGGRYRVARIGDPDVTIDGSHTYVIRYTVPGVLGAPRPGASGSQFYWNLLPGGWQMPIQRASLSATIPSAPGDVRCAVGAGRDTGCDARVSGDSLSVETGALAPHTPVTVRTSLATGPSSQVRLPWTSRLDPVLGQSLPRAILFAVLALLALVVGYLLARAVREDEPAYPLMYAPPDGIGPAQGAYLLTERVSDDAYAATMLQLGEKGVATVAHEGEAWRLVGKDGDWGALDTVTRQTGTDLGLADGGTFTTKPADIAAGRSLQLVRNRFDVDVAEWAVEAGLMEKGPLGRWGRLLVIGCAVVAAVLFFGNHFDFSLAGLPFGWFAVMALPLLDKRSRTVRTAAGRDAWSRVGGFRRVLGTTSSEARFDFSGRHELYLQYVPWAVAFGVAEVWAQKYRVEMHTEPPVPAYFAGGYASAMAGSAGGPMGGFSDSFNGSVAAAVSAYQASVAPSSSGGGGFSGGGGGGGGSW